MRGSFHKWVKKQTFPFLMHMSDLIWGPEKWVVVCFLCIHDPCLCPDTELAHSVNILLVPLSHTGGGGLNCDSSNLCKLNVYAPPPFICYSFIPQYDEVFEDRVSNEVIKVKWGCKGGALTLTRIGVFIRRKRICILPKRCVLPIISWPYHTKNGTGLVVLHALELRVLELLTF